MENRIVNREERPYENEAVGSASSESAACESASSESAACESVTCENLPGKTPAYKNVFGDIIMPWVKKYSHPAGIVICSLLLVFCITLSIILLKVKSNLQNTINEQNKIISNQESTINNLIVKLDKNSEAITKLEDQLKNKSIDETDYGTLMDQISVLNKKAFANDLGHFVSGGIVTEHFVIDRAIFWLDDDRLKGIMDIIPQPNYEKNYTGQGSYKVSDKELANELTQLVKRVENMYVIFSGKFDWAPEFSKSFFSITTSNYNVAVFENNEITIQGK